VSPDRRHFAGLVIALQVVVLALAGCAGSSSADQSARVAQLIRNHTSANVDVKASCVEQGKSQRYRCIGRYSGRRGESWTLKLSAWCNSHGACGWRADREHVPAEEEEEEEEAAEG
jgi:hypothetical protein